MAHEEGIVARDGRGMPVKSTLDLMSAWRRMRRTRKVVHAARPTSSLYADGSSGARAFTRYQAGAKVATLVVHRVVGVWGSPQ